MRPNTNSRAAHTRISMGSDPVRGRLLLPEELPDPLLDDDPLDELPLDPANVNGNDAVALAPVKVRVWAPASRLVGITIDAVTFPVLSATAVPSVTVAEWTAIVTVSPGTNPVAVAVNCCPPASVELATTGLPAASTRVTDAPPATVVVVFPLDCVVVVVDPDPDAVVVVVPPEPAVVLVVPPVPAVVLVVPPEPAVVVVVAPPADVVGGPLLATVQVTWAGLSDGAVVIVIWTFQ